MKKKTTKQKPQALTRKDGKVTINAEAIDELFEDVIAKLYALQLVWEKISLKEELRDDA
jgi:hypothetical protein